jgi:hypothetical protein
MVKRRSYWFSVLIALDQLLNALLYGDPDETLSSRAGKAMLRGDRWGCVFCRVLDWIDRDHCRKSMIPDEGRKIP